MVKPSLDAHRIVSPDDWLKARKQLLAQEKEFTRLRDRLSQQRRELPWVKVEKNYVFDGPRGKETLADLFDGRSQLVVYHFMFAPEEGEEPCRSCSFWADNFNPIGVHLNHRDVAMVAISRAPYEELEAFKRRMGWSFKWVSSGSNDFNYDYHVSFTPEEKAKGKVHYNYTMTEFPSEEAPGLSAFVKDHNDEVFHTYSSYARGLDILIGTYNFLDMAPKGRDEGSLPWSMAWVKRHDEYEALPPKGGCCG